MKYILSVIFFIGFFAVLNTAHATIILDATSTSSVDPGTSLTWSHTVTSTGSNSALFVAGEVNSNATINSVTFNGVALTHVTSSLISLSANQNLDWWYLMNPVSGAHSIVINASGNVAILGIGISFTGVDSSQINGLSTANVTSSVSGTTNTVTVTTTIDNSWSLLWQENNAGTPVAGSNATLLLGPTGWSGASGLFRNTNPITPAGGFSMTYTWPNSASVATEIFFAPATTIVSAPAIQPQVIWWGDDF